MRKSIILIFLFYSFLLCAQNIEDAYKLHSTPTPSHWPGDEIVYWDGEYQIFLDMFFWNNHPNRPLEPAAISFSIEVVSFPFIPENFNPSTDNNFSQEQTRNLNTDIASGYNLAYYTVDNPSTLPDYAGIGWQFGGYNIFKKLDNINNCDDEANYMCRGDYGLISQVYANGLSHNWDQQCHLPHTVLKHTLYFHCGESIDNEIIDSISWVYDNTRGAMRSYPFWEPTIKDPELNTSSIDVAFRPTFPDIGDWYYIPNPPNSSNSMWYDSGIGVDSAGSVDYFPPEEVLPNWNKCLGDYPLYYNPNPTFPSHAMQIYHSIDYFFSLLVHPPSYILLDAPLLNVQAGEYAGYNSSGQKIPSISQTYEINEPFNLKIINPSEKIIYNPSEVDIYCDLTFPCYYKFLTLHGKYPDKGQGVLNGPYSKAYWDAIPYFDFEYDRDYPVPVNCSTNSECISNYIIHSGKTITFQPPIIIMDAHFSGTSYTNKTTIHLDPDKTYGNWTYDEETVELDLNIQTLPVCEELNPNIDSIGNKSTIGSNSISSERKIHLKVLNGLTKHPKIEVNINDTHNAHLMVYNSFGTLIKQDVIISEKKIVDYSSLIPGVYHAVLICNGQTVDRLSFSKL